MSLAKVSEALTRAFSKVKNQSNTVSLTGIVVILEQIGIKILAQEIQTIITLIQDVDKIRILLFSKEMVFSVVYVLLSANINQVTEVVFFANDKSKSRSLSQTEFETFLKQLGIHFSPKQLKKLSQLAVHDRYEFEHIMYFLGEFCCEQKTSLDVPLNIKLTLEKPDGEQFQ